MALDTAPIPTSRVLHVIAARGFGGAERMLSELVAARRSEPFDQVVVNLMQDATFADAVRGAGAEYFELGLHDVWQAPGTLLTLARLIRRLSPGAVQTWLYYADLMTLAALALSDRRATPRLYWGIRCSDINLELYGPLLRWAVRLCTRLSSRPDGVVANSFAGLAVHRRLGYAPRRAAVIPNGIDTARFRPDWQARQRMRAELAIQAEQRVVLHAARVDPMKDHDSALAAAAVLPDVTFILAGAGTQRLRVPQNVIALGVRNDMPAIYAASDLLLSSSAFGEGFPNAIAEAMACGVPAVVTDTGDSRRIVGETGLVVAPRDDAGMAQALRSMLDELGETRAARANAARERIDREFSLARAVATFDALHLRGVWPSTDQPDKPIDTRSAPA